MAGKRAYTDEQIAQAFSLVSTCKNLTEVSVRCGIPAYTVRRWLNNKELTEALYPKKEGDTTNILEYLDKDKEIVEHAVLQQRKIQNLMDSNRIERKSFREHARAVNAIEELTKTLIETFTTRKFNLDTVRHESPENTTPPIGVIQLSDLHFNMVIGDIGDNKFNLDVACKRTYKHVCQSINKFKSEGVNKVVLALTGDLVKNIKHLSEISTNSISRSNCLFLIVDVLIQAIKHLNDEGFNVVIASVVGNESRLTDYIHDDDFLASDSFDLMVHKTLQYMLGGQDGVEVLPMHNPIECVLTLNGSNLLMVHGNAHGRLASTSTLEKNTDSIVARYSAMGTKVDYVILGHIHSAYISDKFARSGGLPGTDEYAARKLNLFGRASQNAFLFYADGSIDGFKHDLQNVDGWLGYRYDQVAAALSIPERVMTGKQGHNMVLTCNGTPFAAYTV